jgi:hypothetical protein
MSTWKLLAMGAVALALNIGSAQAGPVASGSEALKAQATEATDVTQVQYRRYYRGGGWGYRRGPWIGLGAGIVAGAIIADRAYRPRPGYYYDDEGYEGPYYYPSGYQGDPRVVCAENFRSFEWRTGLYTTYSGEKRLCPYLR